LLVVRRASSRAYPLRASSATDRPSPRCAARSAANAAPSPDAPPGTGDVMRYRAGDLAREPGLAHHDCQQVESTRLGADENRLDAVACESLGPALQRSASVAMRSTSLRKSTAHSLPRTVSSRSPETDPRGAALRTAVVTSSLPPSSEKARWPTRLRAAQSRIRNA